MFGQVCQEWSYQVIPHECDSSFRLISKDCYSGYFNWHELWSHHQLPGQRVFGNCSRPSTVFKSRAFAFSHFSGQIWPTESGQAVREEEVSIHSRSCLNKEVLLLPQSSPWLHSTKHASTLRLRCRQSVRVVRSKFGSDFVYLDHTLAVDRYGTFHSFHHQATKCLIVIYIYIYIHPKIPYPNCI